MSAHRLLFESWLIYLTGMVLLGWGLSFAHCYQWIGWASIPLLAGCGWHLAGNWRRTTQDDRRGLLDDIRFPPFLLIIGLVGLAGILYLPAVLDSVSYRIPRMLIWLQEGGVVFVDNPDARLNFMTPVWGFANSPLYLISGFHLLWLGGLISWILLYLSMVLVAVNLGAQRRLARWLALIPSASVGFVLQASSTMNDGWAAALIAMSLVFILHFEKQREFRDILGSGISLALAANTKPHFAVLALPWVLWAIFSSSKPLAKVRWKWALPAAAIVLICSPVPTFLSNYAHYGSATGPAGDGGFSLGPPWSNIWMGGVMMVWSVLQPPINPFAKQSEQFADSFIHQTGLHDLPSRFNLTCREVPVVDGASLGLVAALALGIGVVIALRKYRRMPLWPLLSALAGLAGISIVIIQVVPSTLGRSFLGFLVLMIPLGIAGLVRLKRRWIIGASVCSLLASLAPLVLAPGRPLWPVRTIARNHPGLSSYLEPYLAFQERATAGKSLVGKIPPQAREVGILANGDQNLIHLWGTRDSEHHVRFFPADVTLDDLAARGPEFLILAGAIHGAYLGLAHKFANDPRFSIVATEYYQTRNDRGREPWTLIRLNTPISAAIQPTP